jgi:large subunit ribosomal protein L35
MQGRTASRAVATASRRVAGPSTMRYNSTTNAPASSTDASSSTSSPSTVSDPSWSPPLPPGQHKAYDLAVSYLQTHRDSLLPRISKLKSLPNPTSAQLRQIESLEVEAFINDPATRSTFRKTRGEGMMSRPVFRHMAERKWKKSGGLDLIMGRVYQNKVVPDVLPDLAGTMPLTLRIAEGEVEPAIYLEPSKLETPPRITFQLFQHPSQPSSFDDNPKALFTLLTLDPDVPDPEQQTFSERLMSLKTDIPLCVADAEVDLLTSAQGNEVFSWEPPAPPRGSKTHRYISILLRQSESSQPTISSRENFSLRRYLESANLNETAVYGITLFRAEWTKEENEYIDRIWRDVRGRSEGAPVYGKGPKVDRYGYPLNATQQKAQNIRREAWEQAMEDRGGMSGVSGSDAIDVMEESNLRIAD